MPRVLALLLTLLATSALARNVVYVDNARAGGQGTADKPFATLAEAQARSIMGDVIYVGEGNAPYEGGIALKEGQQLVGAAAGLDDPLIPAVQGPGPVIHGSISLAGDNVVAGITLAADAATGISAAAPRGPITIRKTYIRVSKQAFALYLQNCLAPVTIDGGGIDGVSPANGVAIDGGGGDVTFDKFPIGGTFASAVLIGNRTGGKVLFRNGSKIAPADATRDAIVVQNSKGSVTFDSPLRLVVHGGRGFVAANAEHVSVTGGSSTISTVNGAAVDVRSSGFTGAFDSVSAEGKMTDGIVLDKASGKLAVGGGAIGGAAGYAVRAEQSGAVQLTGMKLGAVYLRHIKGAKLSEIEISGGGGITASNAEDLTLDRVHVVKAAKSALTLEEVVGSFSCVLCTFADAGETPLVIEQRFHAARVSFDRLTISALGVPTAAPYLAAVRVSGGARLQLDLGAMQLVDSAGSALSLDAADAGVLSVAISQSTAARLGGAFADAVAHQSARLGFSLRESHVTLPAGSRRPLIALAAGTAAGDSATLCVDVAANELTSGGGAPAVRIAAAGHSQVQIAGAVPAGVEIAPGTAVSTVGDCR